MRLYAHKYARTNQFVTILKIMDNQLDYKPENIKEYILLLSAPILLTIYRYYLYSDNFVNYFPKFASNPILDYYSNIFQFAGFFGLMFVIPVLLVKFIFKERLSDYGLSLGKYKLGLKWLLALPIIAIVLFFAVKSPDISSEYPLAKSIIANRGLIFSYELAYLLLYYIAWEFFFRGFLIFGLAPKFGAVNAILIQTISSCLIHIGKPVGEIIGSIIVGVLFGLIAFKTKSIWYLVILHAAIGILTDLFVVFT